MDLDLKQKLSELKNRFDKINIFDVDALNKDLTSLEEKMQSPEIWSDQKKASELGTQIREIKENLEFVNKWQTVLDDTEVALELEDESLIEESSALLCEMEHALDKFEEKQMLPMQFRSRSSVHPSRPRQPKPTWLVWKRKSN